MLCVVIDNIAIRYFLHHVYSDRLKCRDGGLGFGVEVIKHEHADLGAILLYLNNQHLVAVAYSIDNDQLPQSTQVGFFTVLTAALLDITLSIIQIKAVKIHRKELFVEVQYIGINSTRE